MRISDGSADVCSSNLLLNPPRPPHHRKARVPGDQRQPVRHPPRGPADRAGAAAEDLDPAQAAAPDGRDRGDGIPARQDEEHEVQRRVLRFRSEEHTSELQSLMRISYAVFCLKKKNSNKKY